MENVKNPLPYNNSSNSRALNPFFITGFTDGVFKRKNIKQFSTFNGTNNQLSLVVWGTNLRSLVGTEKFTKQVSNMIKLPVYQKSIIIGLLLSDGWLTFASKTHKNARLGFAQSLGNSNYFLYVFFQLSHYCSSSLIIRNRTYRGKENIGLQFFTRSLPCFTELYYWFYLEGIKIIPNNIYDILTPVALAHWIMGDGQASRHGLVLCTNSYSCQDVVKLINVLMIRYRIECTIHLKRRQNQKIEYLIYIKQASMPLLRSVIIPYLCTSMYYKLNLPNKVN